MDFSLLDSPELPDDFFNESLKEVARDDVRIMYVDNSNIEEVKVSNLVYNDFASEQLVLGYKEPQRSRYDIINDMEPARVVFKWVSRFFLGDKKEFPFVPVPKPVIPPSRYVKTPEMYTIDQTMIFRGYRIFAATGSQKRRFSSLCDDEMRVDVLVSVPMKRLVDCENFLKNRFPYGVYPVDRGRGFFQCVVGSEQERDSLLKEGLDFDKCGFKFLVPDFNFTKYYVRKYHLKYNDVSNVVVGFDFNPYSPYSLDSVRSVKFERDGVMYSWLYKGEEIRNFFSYRAKRFHSDVWFRSMFSESYPYNRFLMSLDMVTNTYSVCEKDLLTVHGKSINTRMEFMRLPLLIDPFEVDPRYYNKNQNRSPLRYRLGFGDSYVPYFTGRCKLDSVISNVNAVEEKKGVIKIFNEHNVSQELDPERFFDFCREAERKYLTGVVGPKQYEMLQRQLRSYYVLKEKVIVGTKGNKGKSVAPMTELTKERWKVYRLARNENDKRDSVRFCTVPYAILRYPHNRWGSLVPNLYFMTLEEAITQFNLIRSLLKDPPWLFKMKDVENVDDLVNEDGMYIQSDFKRVTAENSFPIYSCF